MRLIFAGTPGFARVALERLHERGFDIPLVLTQPDRPAGRGLKPQASPVKQFALSAGLPVLQPRSLRLDGRSPEDAASAQAAIHAARADGMVVAAYGLILPPWVLQAPRLGCLNIHASLLPRWRGAAPIHRAVEAGDRETGITIMQMDQGLDTGDLLLAERVPIQEGDTTGTLHDKLASLGAHLIVQVLERAQHGTLQPVPQPQDGVSYAAKITKAQAQVDWSCSAALIARRVRAFNPAPGATTVFEGETLKLWESQVLAEAGGAGGAPAPPGTVLAAAAPGIDVACGQGVLRLTQLQRAGGKRLAPAEFLRGFAVLPGRVLGPA